MTRATTWVLRPASTEAVEPAEFIARANAFTSRATRVAGQPITLVTTRDEDGLRSYFVTGEDASEGSAKLLAGALGARAEQADGVPDLTGPQARRVAMARCVSDNVGGQREMGTDSRTMMSSLAGDMPVGSWVGMSMRTASKGEVRRWQRYLATRPAKVDSHATKLTNAPVVVSMYAASATHSQARTLLRQMSSTLPGFDVSIRPYSPTRLAPAAAVVLAGALLAVAAFFLPDLINQASAFAELSWQVGPWPYRHIAAVGAVVGALMLAGLFPTRAARIRWHVRRGRLPRPFWRIKPSFRGVAADHNAANSTAAEYPLDRRSFMLAPHQGVQVVSPTGTALSGASEAKARAVPLALTERIGPMIGYDESGEKVYLSAAELRYGVSAVGSAGSGKSVALQTIMAWTMMDRVQGTGVPGALGKRGGLVVVEPKLEDATSYMDWARRLGDDVELVEIADRNSARIDIFDVGGSIPERAEFVTDALRYAFEDGAIQGRSAEALNLAIAGGMCVTSDMVAFIRGEGDDNNAAAHPEVKRGSFLHYAYLLLGGLGDEVAVLLFERIQARAQRETSQGGGTAVAEAVASLQTIFGPGKTPAARDAYCQAPRNKLKALAGIDHFFDPRRKRKTSWSQILTEHRAVVILTGTSASGKRVSGEASLLMSALMVYTLREAVERHCEGWEDQGRGTTLMIDELSDVAGSNPAVVEWFKQRGRSYGLMLAAATQNLEQLSARVQGAFLSAETLLAFRQASVSLAESIIGDIAGDGGQWSATDLTTLPKFQAVVRTLLGGRRQVGFTVRTAHWGKAGDVRREMFVDDQMTEAGAERAAA